MRKLLYLAVFVFLGSNALLSQPYVTGASTVNRIAGPTTANNFSTSGGILNLTVVTTLQLQGAGMAYAFFAFETFPASVYGCKVGVQVGSPASTSNFFLHDDTGADMGRIFFGSNGVETNSKCTFSVNGSNITLSPDGTQYTVTLNVALRDPYNGSKYVWVDAYDNNGANSGWNYGNASFTMQSQDFDPQTTSVSPASGSGNVGSIQQFTITTKDTNGAYSLFQNQLVFNQNSSWVPGYDPRARCKIIQDSTFISLESDYPNQAYVNGGYIPFGSSQTMSNSYCTVYPAMSSINPNPDIQTTQITFAVSFTNNFLGQVQDHIYAADNLGHATWDTQANGIWTWNVFQSQPLHATISNVTDSASSNFQVGDLFQIVITGPPNQNVVLQYTHNDVPGQLSLGQTSASGSLIFDSTWGQADLGEWVEVLTVGGTPTQDQLTFSVSQSFSCPGH